MSHPQRPPPISPSPDRRRRQSSHHRDSPRRNRISDIEDQVPDTPRHTTQRQSPRKSSARYSIRGMASELPPPPVEGSFLDGNISRKRSLVRPERNRIDRDHPNYHYRQHAANMRVQPSTTGNDPVLEELTEDDSISSGSADFKTLKDTNPFADPGTIPASPLRQSEPINRANGSRRSQRRPLTRQATKAFEEEQIKRQKQRQVVQAQAPTLWKTYCNLVTFWCPDIALRCFGMPAKAQQRAWREKIGLITIILMICAFVGFLTFGFTQTVCPADFQSRMRINDVGSGYLIIHGEAYDLTKSSHPGAIGVPTGSNVLWDLPVKYGGMDVSFMFQNVNGHCKGLITAANGSDVPTNDNGDLGWYFPCNAYNQDGSSTPNETIPYYLGYACHLSDPARQAYYHLQTESQVYFTWDDVRNTSRNLAVYGSDVLDFDLLAWFNTSQVSYPAEFDQLRQNSAVRGNDLTLAFSSAGEKQMAACLTEIIKVGTIDTLSVGCIASKVVLYLALAFILSVVLAKFFLALIFQWFLCKKYAPDKLASAASSKKRKQDIEDWTEDIYRAPRKLDVPAGLQMSERNRKSAAFLPTTSRFTSAYGIERTVAKKAAMPTTMTSQSSTSRLMGGNSTHGGSELTGYGNSRASLMFSEKSENRFSTFLSEADSAGPAGFVHEAVVPQPPIEWQPYGYPLAHAICLVTCYSEGQEAIRSTLDSIATTDYPNSHKVLLVICDGNIKGRGEEFTTPELVLGMMSDHTILPSEVEAFSYVAVASGSKRHNMAKVYSGFYDYGDRSRVPSDRQQRVPMVVVVKTGTPEEAIKAKPGNRGKRDSQIILMSFLQKVMFDERMTELEFEIFNGIWKITGLSPDFYEVVLMVDADTKVFPDSITHMVSAMVKDPEIMGLCGETKIANKRDSWVTMIQVFEYFISHHLAKSFESVFGGVTCLPGCFSMYRIKSPKGLQNYWVPILANPDIVEHYSENVVDTLHKKNLLLLGEDRYLSTLMLKTFPKRKQVFVPQAVCKTTCPDRFGVLLSQRRRWINSTIHNLMELVLVRDLCGTFCFSMQFVIFVELVGTLVLPAAISFTIYLIISAILDSIHHLPVPIIPLTLLALILGLPAVLIVLTASRWSYVLWMLIYLVSLPIWNGVLPMYAFWKFDDFSWGDTRMAEGEVKGGGHGEAEGEFDSSRITMKRWVDFEQERRMKAPAPRAGGGLQRDGGGGGGGVNDYADLKQQGKVGVYELPMPKTQLQGPPSAWARGRGKGAEKRGSKSRSRSRGRDDFLGDW